MNVSIVSLVKRTDGVYDASMYARFRSIPCVLPLPVVVAWLAFVLAGSFFAFMLPLGEGFDEPWHFAYVQHMVQRARPPSASTPLSKEITIFLESQPVSWGLHQSFPMLQSYEEFWRDHQKAQQFDLRLRALHFGEGYTEVPSALSAQYESHQPPLYYLAVAPVFAFTRRLVSFAGVFTALRIASVLMASFVVPGSFWLAKTVLKSSAAACAVTTQVVLFPGVYSSVIRVSNDALAVPVACWTFLCMVLFLEKRANSYLWGLSMCVMVGLWTKAFFIPIAAGVMLCLLYRKEKVAIRQLEHTVLSPHQLRHCRRWTGGTCSLSCASLISGSETGPF
jgi:Dolichyl-phosphate-mannose-protein mannosyltransferase